jgi:hypothetical protein
VARQVNSLRFENKMRHITSQLNKAVVGTGIEWECINGKTKSSSYLQFYGETFRDNSARIVSETVKNILAKKGVPIIAYEEGCVMVSPVLISDQEANRMNEEIIAELNRLSKIKKLTGQIKSFVVHYAQGDFVKHLMLDKDQLPVAIYEIAVKSDVDLEKVKRIFSGCEVKLIDSKLYVSGHTPASYFNLSLSHPEVKQDDPVCDVFFAPDGRAPRKKQVKKIEPAAEEKKPEEKPVNKIERIVFPSGIYDSSDPKCPIKKVNGLLNGKQYYVLFRIPQHFFPTVERYQSVKNKVEQADVSQNAKDKQGLQHRPTWARNLEDNQMFFSPLRCKHLGSHGKGKIRTLARVETSAALTENKSTLGVFVGMDTKHKRNI